MTTKSCRKTRRGRTLTQVLGATALLAGLGMSGQALAVQSPPGCNANTLSLTLTRSTAVAVPGQTVTFGVSVAVPATDSGGVPACDTSNVTIVARCPDANNNIPPTTADQVLATNQSYPAGTPPTSVGSIDCVMPAVDTNKAISAWSSASGTLLDTELLEGSPFDRANTITVTVTPCAVKIDKQVSCDGGETWTDATLVSSNEDGTNGCSAIGLNTPILVRYRAQNTSESCALTDCELTESNGTFGGTFSGSPDIAGIAPGATTDFIPAVNSPACSTAYGSNENPNEPNTATITCQTGGTPAQASDLASFQCLSVDATVDRQVDCGGGFVDPTQVRANEDGTNGCTAVDGEPVAWQYKGCNAGAAPLYDCTLVDLNSTFVSNPIVVGNLAAGQCSSDLPATKSPQDCSNELEASEAPDLGKVTMTCCTKDVAGIANCNANDRVDVYDVSTVTCSTPSGLNAVKECIDTDLDGTADNVRVTASATSGEVGFENCTATDTIYLDDATCPPAGAGTAIPLSPEAGQSANPFSLAPGASNSLFGTIEPALDQNACNTASVTCTVAGTAQQVTADAPPVVCEFREEEGCITRTPGFWGTHPGSDARIGTYDFLPQTVCGTPLTNVAAGNGNSAIEAMCSVGTDGKILGPNKTQLIRQCTAAYLNVAVTLAEEGDCSSGYPQLNAVLDACCDSDSICTGEYQGSYTMGACINILDEFNNSEDTLDSELLNRPGMADPTACQGSKGNGVVVQPTP
jgi:hypothetical protein